MVATKKHKIAKMNTDKGYGIQPEQMEGTELSDPRHPQSSDAPRTAPAGVFHPRFALPVLALLVFLGAMYWAKSRDPFERVWFSLKTPSHGAVKGIAVLPKTVRPCPVVIYLHGSGGTLMNDGNELRQMAELGMAAVGLEYNQVNQEGFDEEVVALQDYIKQQSWALTNATAWVGLSLGAQRTLTFILNHPEVQPQLLVRMSGGWIPELDEKFKVQDPKSKVDGGNPSAYGGGYVIGCPVLLVHGEKDEVFPAQDARRLAELLKAHGISVTTKILPGRGHTFEPDRALVTRLMGEYCKAMLTPKEPFNGVKERRVWPFWVYFTPAFLWAGFWFYIKNGHKKAQEAQKTGGALCGMSFGQRRAGGGRSEWEKALRWGALGLAVLAVADTAIHWIPPHLVVSQRTLEIARKWLAPPKWKDDFETLAAKSIWDGQQLKTLLDCAELANYNRNELINWRIDDGIYRDYVLSPMIDSETEKLNPDTLKRGHQTGEELNWRRALWESFYPRIRHQQSPEEAAEIVGRYLRERVTIVPNGRSAPGVESIWKRQVADEKGFEIIYVAALRSVGIGARLNPTGKAEFWIGDKWLAAPRPAAASFLWQ